MNWTMGIGGHAMRRWAPREGRDYRFGLLFGLAWWVAMGVAMAATEVVPKRLGEAERLEAIGDFAGADRVLGEPFQEGSVTADERRALEWERERLRRIRRDFSLTRERLVAALEEVLTGFSEAELDRWIGEGRFDVRAIDGEQRFFVSSVSNLFFRYPELEGRRKRPRQNADRELAYWENAVAIRSAARGAGTPYVLPKRFRVRMSITVAPGSMGAGERVSAWLPVPRRFPHQDGIELLGSTPVWRGLGEEDRPLRSVYLERMADDKGGALFEVEYAYTARGTWFDLDPGRSRAFDSAVASSGVAEYLNEAPHVRFTAEMERLAGEIAGDETNAVRRARAYYEWIASNIRYSFAPEYSTIRNLGEACRREGRGDCGQAAFLFMTLCRMSGIPARWQSGWAIFPGDETIHDWCEIFLVPWGWVPVDPYMGMYAMQYIRSLSPSQREELRDFYFGGLTQYRMAANSDHHQPLTPPKKSMRSDEVDFQRGEVEAGGTNVYFDRFRYELKWEEVPVR